MYQVSARFLRVSAGLSYPMYQIIAGSRFKIITGFLCVPASFGLSNSNVAGHVNAGFRLVLAGFVLNLCIK